MRILALKYITITFTVFWLQLPGGDLYINQKTGHTANARGVTDFNNSPEEDKSGLEINPGESRPAGHAEKVEPTVIPVPYSNHMGVRYLLPFSLQIKTLPVRESSLSGHFSLLLSITKHKSPVINILRI